MQENRQDGGKMVGDRAGEETEWWYDGRQLCRREDRMVV